LLECLDAEGKVIRAARMNTPEGRRSDAAEVPALLQTDPQAALLTHFANLLHRAYEHSTEIAFVKMVEVMERIGDRAEAIEQRLERTEAQNRRLVQDQVEDAFERAAEQAAAAEDGGAGGGFLQQMAGAFMSGQLQNTAAKPPVKTNGAGKHPTPPKGQA